MTEFIALIVLTSIGLYWLSAMRAKDVAIASARRECKLCDVQLLDQTVQQIHISMSRDISGSWRIWREYRFEYSEDGTSRQRGSLILLGHRVVRISLESFDPIIH